MNIIEKVTIDGLWGNENNSISFPLDKNFNFLIGQNRIGKLCEALIFELFDTVARPGVIGISIGVIGTAMSQQHLRNVLVFLDMPTMGQPEVFLQAKDGLFDEMGNIGADSKQFLQDWMNKYVAWVKQHATL